MYKTGSTPITDLTNNSDCFSCLLLVHVQLSSNQPSKFFKSKFCLWFLAADRDESLLNVMFEHY